MPIYEYVCMHCESHFEELVGANDPAPGCPDCGGERVAKQFSVFAAHASELSLRSGEGGTSAGGGCCGGSCGCG